MSGSVFEPCSPRQAMMLEKRATFTILGGAAGCFGVETEVLTKNRGWVSVKEYRDGDDIATYFPEDGSIGFLPPGKLYAIPSDELLTFENGKVKMEVCEDHTFTYMNDGILEDLPASFIYNCVNTYGSFNGELVTVDHKDDVFYQQNIDLSDIKVGKTKTSDGYKYCFNTLTGYFIIRQNGTAFVTGNSGKSYTLLLDPLKYVYDPEFNAIVFRRTSVQLSGQGGLWQTANSLYSKIPAPYTPRFREKGMWVIFPRVDTEGNLILNQKGKPLDGASIQFMHMEHEKDRISHQGLQYSAEYFDKFVA